MDVEVGDEVIFSKYGGTEIKVGADDVLILRESDILAKVVGDRAYLGSRRNERTWLTRSSSSTRRRAARSSAASASSPTRSR